MKKKILLAIIFITTFAHAQVKFEASLTEAFQKAKAQNKIVFIEYYNSECSVCKKLGTLLETDTLVSKVYNKNFINYKLNTLNPLKEDEKQLMDNSKLNFSHVPVLLFFDADKNYVHHSSVNLDKKFVMTVASKALSPLYRNSDHPRRYKEGDRSIRTLYAYSEYLEAIQNDSLLKIVTNDLYETYTKEGKDLNAKTSYTVLKSVVNSTENGFFIHWINNLDKLKGFEKGYNKDKEQEVLEKIVLKELADPNIKEWSESKKKVLKSFVLKLDITDNPDVYFE